RLSMANDGSTPAVTLLVYKVSGGDITKISDAARAVMDDVIATNLPDNVTSLVLYDMAEYIRSDLSSLTRNGMATVVLVFLILLLFLGLREALIASMSIP